MRSKKRLSIVVVVMMLLVSIIGCSRNDQPQPADDEIMLMIQLDVKEDIGLLILDKNVNGKPSGGGISNANKTMLKKNELLFWTESKTDLGAEGDVVDYSVVFRVITEYFDPNFDNIYPEEYTVRLDQQSFTAEFGKAYSITITGDKVNGYKAVLNESE